MLVVLGSELKDCVVFELLRVNLETCAIVHYLVVLVNKV